MGARTAQAFQSVRAYTLNQLEARFGAWLPADLFPKAAKKANSRDRLYTRPRTFWSMLWQSFNPQATGRLVVRQLQALLLLEGGPSVSEEDGAYCRAKARLPVRDFPKALSATARAADQLAPARTELQGRPAKVVDGSTCTAPDTPKNRKAYPPVQCPEPNFPMLRVVVLFSLLSGAVLHVITGTLRAAELPMLYQMFDQLIVRSAASMVATGSGAWAKTTGWLAGSADTNRRCGCRHRSGRLCPRKLPCASCVAVAMSRASASGRSRW